jgi:predicted Fe-Mo cluster-binding NifX family protein
MTARSTYAVLTTTKTPRIAVTSQNFRTITGHAGKTRRFIIFETDPEGHPQEVERLDLPMEMSLHDYHGDDHPLFQLGLAAVVTQGAGGGFVQRMARHGIQVHTTSASDPVAAVTALIRGEPLPAAAPHVHDHGHGHGGHSEH